jgi:exodeoxyribonuclease VII small subunit
VRLLSYVGRALPPNAHNLEAGSVGLEQSIALYREGLRLHAACEARLRDAELKITELGRGVRSIEEAPG